ncbi:MAG: dockerin type I domain-containing protein, partial [Chloroflexota bacterium]
LLCFTVRHPSVVRAADSRQAAEPSASFHLADGSLPNPTTGLLVSETYTAVLDLQNLPEEGLTSATFACRYDPSLIQLDPPQDAGFFGPNALSNLDGPSGDTFVYIISGKSIDQSGTALRINFQTLAPGTFNLDCLVSTSNNSDPSPIPFSSSSLSIVKPVVNLPITGIISANRPVSLSLYSGSTIITSTSPDSNETFSLSAPPGEFTLVASAPGFLNAQTLVSLSNATSLPKLQLIAGDVNQDGTIDTADAHLIGIYYQANITDPAFTPDLNNDGSIDILDLEIIAQNFGQIAPTSWK